MKAARPLVLTQGDPAGIGPEITLKAWAARKQGNLPPFVVIASLALLEQTAERLGIRVAFATGAIEGAADAFADALPVLPLPGPLLKAVPGAPDPKNGKGTLLSIAQSVTLVQNGKARGVVTNPISKQVLYKSGFQYPGHTEYLAALAQKYLDVGNTPSTGSPFHPVMMLWSPTLAVVPVTVHLPLKEVSSRLTADLIVETGCIVARDLRDRFGISNPKLAVAGLNPHAGEGGAMGEEDAQIIAPAVERLRALGHAAFGPLPADTLFHPRAREAYDVVLAMYHDQALIPIKTIAFDEAVNVTLGLPFVRTSPDHGTAFDIAGQGIARPDSLIAAIKLADRLTLKPGAV